MKISPYRGFTILEFLVYISLLVFVTQDVVTHSFALKESVARSNARSSVLDETLILFDEFEENEPPTTDGRTIIRLLNQQTSTNSPATYVRVEITATTTDGQIIRRASERTIWPSL